MSLIILTVFVFLLSWLGTALVRRLALRHGWVSRPRADRWSKWPIALHGGLGFYPAFLLGALGVLIWQVGDNWYHWESLAAVPARLILAAALLAGSLLMFLLGLMDDLLELRPATKFVGQLVGASLFIFAGGVFPLTGIPVLDVMVTYFWFIGITNAVNMLDNMDGLAAGVVIICGITISALTLGDSDLGWRDGPAFGLCVVFVSALLGFWLHNRPPASIFMGDSGSLFLGYVLSALAIPSPLNGQLALDGSGGMFRTILALVIPATVLATPIFDTTLVTLTRKWRAQKVTQGGSDHSSHRLVGLGLSESKAVLTLYALSATGGAVALLMQRFPLMFVPLLGLFGVLLVISGVYLGHVKVKTVTPGQAPPGWTPLVTHFLYKRRVAEVILDLLLTIMCFYSAYLLRFEGRLSDDSALAMASSLPIVVASSLVMNFVAGIYRGQWRLISVGDLPRFGLGALGGTLLSLAMVTLTTRFEGGHSRSAYIIFGILFFLALVGSRLSFRLFDAAAYRHASDGANPPRTSVLIYGAGRGGKLLCDEMRCHPGLRAYVAIGFIDDDPHKIGGRLCGLPIKSRKDWGALSWRSAIEIWVSSRFIPEERLRQCVELWIDRALVRRMRIVVEPPPSFVMSDGAPESIPHPAAHSAGHKLA